MRKLNRVMNLSVENSVRVSASDAPCGAIPEECRNERTWTDVYSQTLLATVAQLSDEQHLGGTSAPNWFRSHLAALGSAAVISVYAAGYFRTEGAASRVADGARDAAPERRPVARTPVAPQEIAPAPIAREAGTVAHA